MFIELVGEVVGVAGILLLALGQLGHQRANLITIATDTGELVVQYRICLAQRPVTSERHGLIQLGGIAGEQVVDLPEVVRRRFAFEQRAGFGQIFPYVGEALFDFRLGATPVLVAGCQQVVTARTTNENKIQVGVLDV